MALVLGGCGDDDDSAASSTTSSAPTTSATSTTATTGPDATAVLDEYVHTHPAVVSQSRPVHVGDETVAVVGRQPAPQHDELVVLELGASAREVATIVLPPPAFDLQPGLAIDDADLTDDGEPDFLAHAFAADNGPGVVLSSDGGSWHLVPIEGPSDDVWIGRDPAIVDGTLTTYDNDCDPSCAEGSTTTVTWTYDRAGGRLVRSG